MQPSLEKLRKFFRLEAERGYSNDAIIGGLAKMLDYWEDEARADGLPETLIAAVAARLRDYERLSPKSRKEALTGLWQRIKRETGLDEAGSVPPTRSSAPRPRKAPRRTSHQHPGGLSPDQPAALDAPLTVLPGIGPRNAKRLEALGLRTLGDMLYYFPRRYDDYTQLKPIKDLWYGEQVTVIGQVRDIITRPIRGGKASLTEIIIHDGTAALRLSFFNQPWMANRYTVHDAIVVSGKVEQYLGRLVMNNPDIEPVETRHLHTHRIVPVYPLTANVSQKWLREKIASVVQFWAPRVSDPVPESVRQGAALPPLSEALLQIHLPDSHESLQAARRRLAFDEIFYLQLGVLRQKQDWQSAAAAAFAVDDDWLAARLDSLPFTLTGAQQRVLDEIRADLSAGRPMNRLIQGDVGSGKTVVAALAAAIVTTQGAQAAVMAPTAILAEQHYENFTRLLAGESAEALLHPREIRLLVGSTPAAERRETLAALEQGEVKILIGTHALIEEPVRFQNLQLAVIDEQHRFGVAQRAALRQKGVHPHLLVMTATPIPRSLALTLYGDLDLSIIDEMPAGRQPVKTYVLTPAERERAYTLIRGQLAAGRQAFIVYPLIEESEKSNLPAAVEAHKRLQAEVFPNYKVGLLHGRMKADEKEAVMQQFRDGEFQVLVSTTVIEVGVDVPNATVMLIEGANRFGLAQLHQLRGRVGRGGGEAYCLLIPEHENAAENERLQAMAETNDGFLLAEYDLKQRGPGEFLGTRQAGFSTLRMANLSDVALIEVARQQAESLFATDPGLQRPEHQALAATLGRFWRQGQGDIS